MKFRKKAYARLYFPTSTLMGSQSAKLLSIPTMLTFWVPDVANLP